MITPLSFTLISLCITVFVLWYWKKNHNLPPGPTGLPFFGYYPFLSKRPFVDFAKLAKRYGDVISFKTVGGSLIVVLNGVDTIKNVLINRADEFIGRPNDSNLIEWISDKLGVTQEEGQPWKEHRRFFLQNAKNFGFGKVESENMIHEEIKTLIKDVQKDNGQPSDFKFHVAYLVNSVVCQIIFSKKFDKYDESFKDIYKNASYLVEIFTDQRFMLVGPIYQHVVMKFLPSTRRIRKAKQHFRKVVKEILDEHISRFDPENLRDYVDSYLHQAHMHEKRGEKNHSFTRERLAGISFNMLMEGTESVGGTICGLLDIASRQLEEQKLVQKELDSVVGRERLPSWLDRPNLPYVEAFIQELYRSNMPFNISTQYSNFKETTINGYRIPRRTVIVSNQWTVNNDPKLYPEPTKFNIRRFIDENGKKIKTDGPNPFGVGKRSCIGESLAQMEVFLVISSILQNFTLHSTGQSGRYRAEQR